MNMHRQNAQLLDLFKRDGTVTRLTAMHYGIANVTARIADLRLRHGINVVCEKRTDAKGKTYGAWSIKKDGSAAKVGDRIRITSDPRTDGAFYSKGAEGTVVLVATVYPSYPICVRFDSGEFNRDDHAFDASENGSWFVRAGEFEVL
jgi:hypothetical protein